MKQRVGFGRSPALVIAALALLVAAGGTAYAASNLPPASIGARHLKKNAVGSPEVRNGTLLPVDFRAGQVGVGPPGQAGPPGAKGDKGDSAKMMFAVVNDNASVAHASGLISSIRVGPGHYRVTFNQIVTGCAYVASVGARGFHIGYAFVARTTELPQSVTVQTLNDVGGIQDRSFYLVVLCKP
jgi:hypothetical protein